MLIVFLYGKFLPVQTMFPHVADEASNTKGFVAD